MIRQMLRDAMYIVASVLVMLIAIFGMFILFNQVDERIEDYIYEQKQSQEVLDDIEKPHSPTRSEISEDTRDGIDVSTELYGTKRGG